MPGLARFSISMDASLCRRLDSLIGKSRYANRSEFVRDIVRERLVEEAWKRDREAVGTITLIYDHHTRGLTQKLLHLQHHHAAKVLATTHVHLEHDLCVEVIIVRGRAGRLRELADLLRQQKGVLHGTLSLGSTGRGLR